MYKYKNLPDIISTKVIPKNFGRIKHLRGSKMIDADDKLLSKQEQEKYTICKKDKNDIVIITEKIDGMNAGVVKKNGVLYPINRKGYDVRAMQYNGLKLLFHTWAKWVDDNYELYDKLLEENERLAFENAILKHTLKYKFKCDPVFLLAKIDADNKKINYEQLTKIAITNNIQQPPLLNMGVAIDPQIIIAQYPKGKIGVCGKIEGIVYNYEHNGEHESCAKFVSNELLGTENIIPSIYNSVKIK